ncbi:hypothetical protein K402DRAFT_418850 [Aulographum hederae CBS 113979]|uniref:NAD dependent epimerase/dehydratase family protein-like protein n=1 Tax=Aulographum hederae CBS 113979 TaxID=1176131 RepID=A0A6G1H747_9PEZI|nr:hypothetical protein K402DRAFT_418850 [Aulographum hederae CBS 113979]
MTTTAFLAGSTGLIGSHILPLLTNHPSISHTHAYTRRTLPIESPTLTPLTAPDQKTWPSLLIAPYTPSSVFISALGTTRAQAGGLDKQREIDLDLNLALAKAAREKGVQVYVIVSSASASSSSRLPYSKLKGELEDEVIKLGFPHTIILRPGLIVGERSDSRPAEWLMRKIAGAFGAISPSLKDFWAQDAEVIARAAVRAAVTCVDKKREEGVWVLAQGDIVKIGKAPVEGGQ